MAPISQFCSAVLRFEHFPMILLKCMIRAEDVLETIIVTIVIIVWEAAQP